MFSICHVFYKQMLPKSLNYIGTLIYIVKNYMDKHAGV